MPAVSLKAVPPPPEQDEEDQQLIDELTVICDSLGKLDENDGTYLKNRDCHACLREMLRYIMSDSKRHVTRCHLGLANVIKSDLIPLMVQYCDYTDGDSDLFSTVIRLCTNLTSSALLLFTDQELPSEPDEFKVYQKLLKGLYGYKEAFANNEKIWATLNVHLKHNTDDEILFERLIILIRNILHVPVDSAPDMGVDNSFDTHDMCLYRMAESGILNTMITLASETEKGAQYCFHLTEIFYLMLRDQNPALLAIAQPDYKRRRMDDDDIDKKRLIELSERNRRERHQSRDKILMDRFRRSGTFTVQNIRALGGGPIVVANPIGGRNMVSMDKGKQELRKAKNKKPMSSETSMRISDRNTKPSKASYSLRIFCNKFIDKVYNNFMQHIKHNLIQKNSQDNDETYYLWAIQFFTAYTRLTNSSIDHIKETLSVSTLHYIQILISGYDDKIKMEKKKFQDTSKRLHFALRAYREILNLIKTIDSESPHFKTVESIRRNMFTEVEYNSLLLNLLRNFDEPKHSEHYLHDLIQTNYVFLDLLDADTPTSESTNDEPESERATSSSKKNKSQGSNLRSGIFVSRYCSPDVIKAHMDVLKKFKLNDDATNLAVLRFLERIVYDCRHETMLYQASVFRCLMQIVEHHSSMPGWDRFNTLAMKLIEGFGRAANKKRWMFEELLFWKTANDALEIENAIDPPPAPEPDLARDPERDPELDPERDSQPELQPEDNIEEPVWDSDDDVTGCGSRQPIDSLDWLESSDSDSPAAGPSA